MLQFLLLINNRIAVFYTRIFDLTNHHLHNIEFRRILSFASIS